MENKKQQNNALLSAKLENGYVNLTLKVGDIETSIKVNDFGGKQKDRAKKLAYKIYKAVC